MLQLADSTVQMNPMLPEKIKKRYYTKKLPKNSLVLTKKVQKASHSQVLLECSLSKDSDQYQSCTGLVIPSDRLEAKCSIALTSSLCKIDDKGQVFVSAINFSDIKTTLTNQTETAHSEILNEAQAENLIKIDPQLISFAKMRNSDNFEGKLNQLFQEFHFKKSDTPTGRPLPDYSNF